MSCEFCKNAFVMDDLADLVSGHGEVNFCPVCGANLQVQRTLVQIMNSLSADVPHIIKDENGEVIIFERQPSDPPEKKEPVKPMDYSIDLDNVNIDREIEILNKRGIKTK